MTVTAVGDADDVTDVGNLVADGDIDITDAAGATAAVLSATGEITQAVLTAAVTVDATAGADSVLDDLTAATTLTVASTDALGVTFDLTGGNAQALRTINLQGENDVTVRMAATDLVAATAALPAASTEVAGTDTTTGASTTAYMFDTNAGTAQIDVSGLVADEFQLTTAQLLTGDSIKVASGQNIVNKVDQGFDINITAAAVAGNSVTVTVADDKVATSGSTLSGITTTNIGTLNIAMNDAASSTDGMATGAIDVAASTIVNMTGVTDVTVASVDGQEFNASTYTGDITISATNNATSYKTGLGDDTINNSTTAASITLDAGAGLNTFMTATEGDYSALSLGLTNVQVIEVVDGVNDTTYTTLTGAQLTGSNYVITGSGVGIVGGDVLSVAATGVAETINLSGVTNSIGVVITGSAGADIITTGVNGMTVNAGDAADTVNGNDGVDTIDGGNGADNITGGNGADYIDGKAGADTIILTETTAAADEVEFSVGATTVDTVTGFSAGGAASNDNISALDATFSFLNSGASLLAVTTGATMKAADAADVDATIFTISTNVAAGTFDDFLAGTINEAAMEAAVITALGATGTGLGTAAEASVVLVAVDDGEDTGLFVFSAANATDDAVTAAELQIGMVLDGVADATTLVAGDFLIV